MSSLSGISVKTCLGLCLPLLRVGLAAAQTYPSKPINFVVPFAPGGTSDVLARAIAQKLSQAWGQTIVVENRPGAGGNIPASGVSKAAPDGHTIMIAAAAIAVSPSLYKDPGFRLFENLVPVTVVGTVPFMLVVNPSLPAATFAEFIDYARKNPNKLSLGSGGNGTIPHLGVDPVGSAPDEAADFLRAEVTKWAGVVKASGAKVD